MKKRMIQLCKAWLAMLVSHALGLLWLSGAALADTIDTTWAVATNWHFKDNHIYRSTIVQAGSGTIFHNYNGYESGYGRITPNAANDVVYTNAFAYASSHLGNYYHSSSHLQNAGSRTAPVTGLYHHTTLTAQTKEGSGTVDIGFHYVAANSSSQAEDGDADGIPDYLEDIDGNGAVDSGETNPNSATDVGLKVVITEPKSNSNLP